MVFAKAFLICVTIGRCHGFPGKLAQPSLKGGIAQKPITVAHGKANSIKPIPSPQFADFQHLERYGENALLASRSGASENTSQLHSLQKLQKNISNFVQANFLVCGMAFAVSFAKLAPSLGAPRTLVEILISKVGVFMVFLISGWSLELTELKNALLQFKLNGLIQGMNMIAWPYLIGLPLTTALRTFAPWALPASVLDGILILTCLPTTVNMCIFLTQTTGGNVACALCNVVIGNTLGILVTPALLLRFFGTNIKLPFLDMVSKLFSKVLVPVVIGQMLRAAGLQDFYKRNAKIFKKISEISLMSIVWTAFCSAFSQGVGLEAQSVAILLFLLPALHLASIAALFAFFKLPILKLKRGDIVAATFTASHKTLAFGLPLIKTVFDGNPNLAPYCAPVVLLYPLQLVLGSFLTSFFSKYIQAADEEKAR